MRSGSSPASRGERKRAPPFSPHCAERHRFELVNLTIRTREAAGLFRLGAPRPSAIGSPLPVLQTIAALLLTPCEGPARRVTVTLPGSAITAEAQILVGAGSLLARQRSPRQRRPSGAPVAIVEAIVRSRIGSAPALGNPVPNFVLLPRLPLIASALINAEGAARESPFDPVSAGEVAGNSSTQPVFEAAAGAALSVCRASGNAS
jgi:hypothetical protein